MKITHIINKAQPKKIHDLIELQRKSHDVVVINIDSEEPKYDEIIDQVMSSDRVISWGNVHSMESCRE